MNFFLDLDGPILDVSRRHWIAYAELLRSHRDTPLTREKYWSLKRSKAAANTILAATGSSYRPEDFSKDWIAIVETKRYLGHDEPWPDTEYALSQLNELGRRVLVTLRRSRRNLEWELEHFRLLHYLDQVLSSGEKRAKRWEVKVELILNNGYSPQAEDFMIGDTETDILAGKTLGIQTVAVTNGIRDASLLSPLEPDFIVNSLGEFVRSQIFPKLEHNV